jgi:hypothetical protein
MLKCDLKRLDAPRSARHLQHISPRRGRRVRTLRPRPSIEFWSRSNVPGKAVLVNFRRSGDLNLLPSSVLKISACQAQQPFRQRCHAEPTPCDGRQFSHRLANGIVVDVGLAVEHRLGASDATGKIDAGNDVERRRRIAALPAFSISATGQAVADVRRSGRPYPFGPGRSSCRRQERSDGPRPACWCAGWGQCGNAHKAHQPLTRLRLTARPSSAAAALIRRAPIRKTVIRPLSIRNVARTFS